MAGMDQSNLPNSKRMHGDWFEHMAVYKIQIPGVQILAVLQNSIN